MSVCHDSRFTPEQYALNLRLEQSYFAKNEEAIAQSLRDGADIELPPLRLPHTIDGKASPPTLYSCLPIGYEDSATIRSKLVDGGPVYLTIAGLLLSHSIDEKRGDLKSQALMARMLSIAPGGGAWQRQPRAWIDRAMPPGESSNTLIDLMLYSAREGGKNGNHQFCVDLLFDAMNMDNPTLQRDIGDILCEQIRYDEVRSGGVQKRHLSLRLAMVYVQAVRHFPQKLLDQMSALTYESFKKELPMLHFLIDRSSGAERVWEAVVAKAIDAGADPNARSAVDKTPLMHAAFLGKANIVAKLLEAGADPDMGDRRKWRAGTFAKKPAESVKPDDRTRTLAVLSAFKAKQKMRAVIAGAGKLARQPD